MLKLLSRIKNNVISFLSNKSDFLLKKTLYHSRIAILENIPDVVWTSDFDGNTIFISSNVEKVYGYTPDEVYKYGKEIWFERIHPDDVEKVENAWKRFFNSDDAYDIRYRIRNKDDKWIWLYDRAVSTYKVKNKRYADGLFTDVTEQVKREKALRETQNIYRKLFDHAPDPILIIDGHGNYIECNDKALEFLECSKEELLQKNTDDFLPPEYKKSDISEKIMNKHLKLRDEGGIIETEYYINGQIKVLELSIVPLILESKKVVYGIGRDITKQKEFEKKILKSEEQYRKLVDTSPDGIATSDLNGNLTFVSKQTLKIHGYDSEEELLGRSAFELVAPEDIELAKENLKIVFEQGFMNVAEYRFLRKDGSRFYGELSARLIVDEKGEPSSFIALTRDVTERKLAQKELLKTQSLLNSVIKQTTVPMVVAEPDGTLTIFNDACRKILGVENEDEIVTGNNLFEINKTWADYDMDDNLIALEDLPLAKALRGISTNGKTMKVVRKDGTVRWDIVDGSPIYDKDGTLIAGFIAFPDITELILYEQELIRAKEDAEKAYQLKTEFLANTSHELRTPLNTILGFCQVMMKYDLTNEDINEFIHKIYVSGKHLLEIINDILNISKIEAGKENLTLEMVSVNDLLMEVTDSFDTQATMKNIRLDYFVDDDVPETVETDVTKLKQILFNLLSNAIKFTDNGSINVHVEKDNSDEDKLRFIVTDTGIGIPKDYINLIFDTFVQADGSLSRKFSGTGLGLTITKKYVEMLGGKIWVKSQVGLGSTFFFTIEY